MARRDRPTEFMPLFGDDLKDACIELAATIDADWGTVQGYYLAMIWAAWQHEARLIGSDARHIARLLGLKSPTIVAHILGRFWTAQIDDKGLPFFTQRRVGETLAKVSRLSGERSAAGKKANEIRWGTIPNGSQLEKKKRTRTNVDEGTDVKSNSEPPRAASTSARDARELIDATQPKLFDTDEPDVVEVATMSLDDLAEVWNNFAEINDLPKIEGLTPRRRSALKARVAEIGGADAWCRLITERVGRSDFLTGKIPPRGDRRKPFRVDFDWLSKPDNFAKVREGKYSNEKPEDQSLR
jgi:uncharacterized protein YdaU (DUF1376 family)